MKRVPVLIGVSAVAIAAIISSGHPHSSARPLPTGFLNATMSLSEFFMLGSSSSSSLCVEEAASLRHLADSLRQENESLRAKLYRSACYSMVMTLTVCVAALLLLLRPARNRAEDKMSHAKMHDPRKPGAGRAALAPSQPNAVLTATLPTSAQAPPSLGELRARAQPATCSSMRWVAADKAAADKAAAVKAAADEAAAVAQVAWLEANTALELQIANLSASVIDLNLHATSDLAAAAQNQDLDSLMIAAHSGSSAPEVPSSAHLLGATADRSPATSKQQQQLTEQEELRERLKMRLERDVASVSFAEGNDARRTLSFHRREFGEIERYTHELTPERHLSQPYSCTERSGTAPSRHAGPRARKTSSWPRKATVRSLLPRHLSFGRSSRSSSSKQELAISDAK